MEYFYCDPSALISPGGPSATLSGPELRKKVEEWKLV